MGKELEIRFVNFWEKLFLDKDNLKRFFFNLLQERFIMTEYFEIAVRVTGLILFTIPSVGMIRDLYRQQKAHEELMKARRSK